MGEKKRVGHKAFFRVSLPEIWEPENPECPKEHPTATWAQHADLRGN